MKQRGALADIFAILRITLACAVLVTQTRPSAGAHVRGYAISSGSPAHVTSATATDIDYGVVLAMSIATDIANLTKFGNEQYLSFHICSGEGGCRSPKKEEHQLPDEQEQRQQFQAEASHMQGLSPVSLAAYCLPPEDLQRKKGLVIHQYVEGNWKGYGSWFLGVIIKENEDDTFNVRYYDGMEESDVPAARLRVSRYDMTPKIDSSKSDPACIVKDIVAEMQYGIDAVQQDVSKFIDEDVGGFVFDRGEYTKIRELGNTDEERNLDWAPDKESNLDQAPAPAAAVAPAGAVVPVGATARTTDVNNIMDMLRKAYGSPEAVVEAADQDADGWVTTTNPEGEPSELERVIGQSCNASRPEVTDMVYILAAKLDPQGSGKIDSQILKEAIASVVDEENDIESDEAHMKHLEDFHKQVEDYSNQLEKDYDRFDEKDLNATSPDEMKRLIIQMKEKMKHDVIKLAKIVDLGPGEEYEEVDRDELESRDHKSMIRATMITLIEDLEGHAHALKALLKRLNHKVAELKKNGNLDMELKRHIDKVLASGEHMVQEMTALIAHEPSATNYLNGTAITILIGEIKELDVHSRVFKAEIHNLEIEVIPSPSKWWRYSWEYSFVEACILSLLYTLALIWEGWHQCLRRWLENKARRSNLFVSQYFDQVLIMNWSRFVMGEMWVLLSVAISVWFLGQVHFFDLWLRMQYSIFTSVHLPWDAMTYINLAFSIAMKLSLAMICFVWLVYMVVARAVEAERACMDLESQDKVSQGESLRQPSGRTTAKRWPSWLLAKDADEYRMLQLYFYNDLKHFPESNAAMNRLQRRLQRKDLSFPLWYFVARKLNERTQYLFRFQLTTWLLILLISISSALVHLHFQVEYVHIAICLICFALATLVIWICVARQEIRSFWSRVKDAVSVESSQTPNIDGLRLKQQQGSVRHAFLCTLFQLVLFSLCYASVDVLLSPYTWTYHWWYALTIAIFTVVALIVFATVIAPTIVTYILVLSFPPYLNDEPDSRLINETGDEAETRQEITAQTP